jgi:hypothetical protein
MEFTFQKPREIRLFVKFWNLLTSTGCHFWTVWARKLRLGSSFLYFRVLSRSYQTKSGLCFASLGRVGPTRLCPAAGTGRHVHYWYKTSRLACYCDWAHFHCLFELFPDLTNFLKMPSENLDDPWEGLDNLWEGMVDPWEGLGDRRKACLTLIKNVVN